jgi:DNA phosphorothioation-dependent restriction protein DptG|tara:strand:+ start:53 stop:334 length:282 start_codon:yes stop_codon:yes gene_type:complete
MDQMSKIDDIEKKVQNLEAKFEKLVNLLENVKEDTHKMSTHIDFIDNVYSKIRMPLFWICDKVNSFKSNGINYNGIEKSFVKYNSEVPEKLVD